MPVGSERAPGRCTCLCRNAGAQAQQPLPPGCRQGSRRLPACRPDTRPPLPAPAANEKPRKGKKDYSHLEYKCLVRATDGKRKLSTVVVGKDLARFQDAYSTILRVRASCTGRGACRGLVVWSGSRRLGNGLASWWPKFLRGSWRVGTHSLSLLGWAAAARRRTPFPGAP